MTHDVIAKQITAQKVPMNNERFIFNFLSSKFRANRFADLETGEAPHGDSITHEAAFFLQQGGNGFGRILDEQLIHQALLLVILFHLAR